MLKPASHECTCCTHALLTGSSFSVCRFLSCWRNATASLLPLAARGQCMPSWWTLLVSVEGMGDSTFAQATISHCNSALYPHSHPLRHPDPHYRPAASTLCSSLNKPEAVLLFWDMSAPPPSPTAHILGAPLEEGHKLYEDLQSTYLYYI